jgi:membrane protease YdiL (CAAX protease family)
MFRGLLQGRLLRGLLSEHLAIWITAVLFSAIHVEFAGFFPRLLLGVILGYAYRWTGTLWSAILLHLLWNGVQVVMTYASGDFTPDTEMNTTLVPLLLGGTVSLVLTLYLFRRNERALTASPA